MKKPALIVFAALFAAVAATMFPHAAFAADPVALPRLSLSIGGQGTQQELATAIQIIIVLTMLTLAPAILLMMTSFTRLIVVFSILRQALGVPQSPPNQVLIGLSLFLTFFIMSPAINKINETALKPYTQGTINQETALNNTLAPLREFMIRNTRTKDVEMFLKLSNAPVPKTKDDISTFALIPAFVTSELKTAFQIGFLIYLPFLVIDTVVASVLMSMGMVMLPPVIISLPFKLMLFVLVDGWYLLVGSLVQSFH